MSVQTGPRSATLGSDLTQYEQRNRLRQAAQLYAAEDDRIRTCGELAPRRRRDDPNRDIDTGLRRDAHRILGTSYGEHYCERRWTCAVCASIEGKHRREEFCGYFTDWLAGGGSLAVLTLEPAHAPGDPLGSLWAHLRAGRRAVLQGKAWTQDQERFGISGYVWSVEVLDTSAGGWNPHCHMALLMDRSLGLDEIAALRDRSGQRFARGVEKAGGYAAAHAQHLTMWARDACGLAGYLTKSHTRVLAPSRRKNGSRTHIELLSDLWATGKGYDRWHEFDVASVNQQQFRSSNNVADVIAQRSAGHLLGYREELSYPVAEKPCPPALSTTQNEH